MHKLPKKPAGTSSAEGQAQQQPNRGKNKGKRGDQRNDESEEEEESSTYSIDEQSEQYSDDSDTEENRAIHSLPGDFFDCDEHAQRYIWHGPAPVCSSRTAYQFSPFKLDHSFAGWQRVDEHFDMPWPPPLRIRCKSFNPSRMTQAFKAVELDINRWENILTDLWEPAVFNDERFLVLSWVITRLQYLRALYPVMDANKYDFDMRLYYDRAVLIMNTKGPDCTAVVDFISRKKEGAQEDSSVYFDKWFKNNTHFGKWYKDQSTSAQKPVNKHNIEPSQDTSAHKKAKTDTTSTVAPPPSIPKAIQGAPTTPTAKRASAAVNTSSPNPLASGFAATPSSKSRPGSKGFASSSTSPNSPQANATSTTETPPAPSSVNTLQDGTTTHAHVIPEHTSTSSTSNEPAYNSSIYIS
ncbi:hypothetical protein BGX30_004372 [Mortierella sp. GBA39]|nr:hypothetical protein BGX30_004372 [Mortierella sp. GBA39]